MGNTQANLYEVLFRGNRRGIYRNRKELPLQDGVAVLVDANRGLDLGTIVRKQTMYEDSETISDIRRIATEEDRLRIEKNIEKERNAFKLCKERIQSLGLSMKLVDVEMQYDNSKMTFFFTAEYRVDFRELVKMLASIYRTRIELLQIGVRDEAKRIGGISICGRPQCCSTFLNEFAQITTQLARDQLLSLNPTKISGNCGRLLCCLQYEEDAYQEAYRELPRSGYRFTPEGGKLQGDIIFVDIFKKRIHVRYYAEGASSFEWYDLDIIKKGTIDEPLPRKR